MHLSDYTQRRFNPLADEWVLVSPHRTKRPWQGQVEKPSMDVLPQHDASCYLCPGNERAGGLHNPQYESVFVFPNDFAALIPDIPKESMNESDLLVAETVRGHCEVLCFSPRHDLTLPRMERSEVESVIAVWIERYLELGALPEIAYVQIFENRGAVMGCSNPHPHGQIWATEQIPDLPSREDRAQRTRHAKTGKCLLCEYVGLEIAKRDRIIFRNDSFVALVPFWAVWPFEAMILPLRHIASIDCLTPKEISDFADALKCMGTRYDNLFLTSFPYSMGFHQKPTKVAPADKKDQAAAWHFHVHYYPPLLRSATVRKFMVGFELLAMPQRDISPESAAERLRGLSDTHYLEGIDR
ncbi:MAG: UDP-glucose--hexose-1-phosphate uridylyltransferase [Treponemataceae bacterium]